VLLVHRGTTNGDSIKYWVRPDIDNPISEGSIAARFETRVVEITPTEAVLEGPAGRARAGRCGPADAR
jgi:thioredoxin reductase (NADPH)